MILDDQTDEPLESAALLQWLRDHLSELCGPVQLGLLCARLGVAFADVAPAHLPLDERVQRLLSHLAQRGGLGVLAHALLSEEATVAAAEERGLLHLLAQTAPPAPRVAPRLAQPLPPLPQWAARDTELGAIEAHFHAGARVILLRGARGAGKSTLLGRYVRGLLGSADLTDADADADDAASILPPAPWQESGFDGVLYWNFEQAPDIVAFLQAALQAAGGASAATSPTGSWTDDETLAQRLFSQLSDSLASRSGLFLLVLDGLERLQVGQASASSSIGRVPVGDLSDRHLAALLLSITLGTSKAIVVGTVTASIAALMPWLGGRYVEIDLPPLSSVEGAALLRNSGVNCGPESDLELRSNEHSGHALTVHLLGCYLGAYYQGDGRAVTRAELPSSDLAATVVEPLDDAASAGLRQILGAHLLALQESARRLLDLCVLLPGPLRLSSLAALLEQRETLLTAAAAGLEVVRDRPLQSFVTPSTVSFVALPEFSSLLPDQAWLQGATLRQRIEELLRLGLVQVITMLDGEEAVDVHSLLREPIYAEWLSLHGRRESGEPAALDGRMLNLAYGEEALELLEQLVAWLLAAQQPEAAFAVLDERLGGYLHHVHRLGRARRFLLLIRRLYSAIAALAISDSLWLRRYAQLLTWEAETLRVLGQLDAAMITAQRQWPIGSPPLSNRIGQQASIARCAGRLEQAVTLATAARHGARSSFDGIIAAREQALVQLLRGDPAMCQVHLLDAATQLREDPLLLFARPQARHLLLWLDLVRARRAMRLGHDQRARELLEQCMLTADALRSEMDRGECDVLLAELLRRERRYEEAGQLLHRGLSNAARSGDVETSLLGGLVQGRLRMEVGHLDGAATALSSALTQASEHGFGTYRIDILVCRGALSLRRSDLELAERDARDALAYATAVGCDYLWGEADALHLLATVLIAGRPTTGAPRHAEAVAHLSDELELRERMADSTAPEVRWLLRRLRE